MNVTEAIRAHAQRAPQAPAFEDAAGKCVDYGTLERTIDALARRFLALGLGPGQTAALSSRDNLRYIVSALALARVGVAFAPVMFPGRRTDIALVDRDAPANDAARIEPLTALWPEATPAADGAPPVPIHADGAQVLMYAPSSGTTGQPNFTPVSHDLTLLRMQCRAQGLEAVPGGRATAATRQITSIPPTASYGFRSVLRILHGGGTVLQPPPESAAFHGWLIASRANYIVASPNVLEAMAALVPPGSPPNSLATIETGGSALPARTYELARERLCANIIVAYGLTECSNVAWAPAALLQGRPGAVGYPFPGVAVEIVGEDGALLPAGQEGRVRIRSPYAATGYLDNPEGSAQVFRDGCVHPGDLGVREADGLLRITGRADDVINQGGRKISPQPIENEMMGLAQLRECAVFGVTDASGAAQICAAIVTTAPLDINVFHARCRARLGLQAPVYIMQMARLPRNENGKVLRRELARLALEASQKAPGGRG